ncbi:MAG TPA: Rieske (2Fe-2S) protein [Vicinamibacterales bacterium]|nr:Rieske (2Fe-2S) protein [Vicinamibacterales bacterium]
MGPRTSPEPAPASGRRSVLSWLLGTWSAGVLGAIAFPVLRYLVPPEVPEATTLSVKGGSASALAPNSARIVPFGSTPALVVRAPTGEVRAFNATCTHLACTVQYRTDLEHIWCACHNGHYDLNGKNIAGPPPRPLTEYDAHVQGDEIIISKRT